MIRLAPMSPQPTFDGTFWRLDVNGYLGVDTVRWEYPYQAYNRLVRLHQVDPPGPGPCVRAIYRCGRWWWVYRVEVKRGS